MPLRIQHVDTLTAPESLLRELHEFYVPLNDEMLPGDPPTSFERRAADWRRIRSDQRVPRWVLRDGDEIVGSAVAHMSLEENLRQGMCWIYVRPDQRLRGHGRALAGAVFECLEAADRTLLHTWVVEGHAATAACERAGMRSVYRERRSRLLVGAVDLDMMSRWIGRAPERAAAYDIVELQAPFPDEFVTRYCDLQFQMNTAPLEEFELDDPEVLTPEMWREEERQCAASSHELFTCVAVERTTGELVGSTTIQVDLLQPAQAWQWETVVHPDHRNKGLGRLLKASMMHRLVRERPRVERIDTTNAGSNEPMLAINHSMGFQAIQVTLTYQGDLATAKAAMRI